VKRNRAKNLELLTPTTLVVGVDGHAKSNTAAFVVTSGIEPARPFKFTNNRQGFLEFLDKVKWVQKKNGLDNVVFVLEPNGPYWRLLGHFLLERNYTVKVVGALQVKRNRQTESSSPDKNDSKDARSAADLGRQGKFGRYAVPEQAYEDLRCLGSIREDLLEHRSAYKHRLRAALVRGFPELVTCFSDICGKGALALIEKAPTAGSVVALGESRVADILMEASKGRLAKKKAKQVVQTARDSVGYGVESRAVKLEFSVILKNLAFLSSQIEEIESEMMDILDQTVEGVLLMSIPGIGAVSAGIILGETGGLLQYENPSQIRKLAGLDLVGAQSGEYQGQLKISRRGRKILRKILYQCAVSSLHCNELLRGFYDNLTSDYRRNKLKKKQAIVAVAGKLIDVMYSMVKSGTSFDPAHVWSAPGEHMTKAAA
jgi:transposase